MQPVGFKWLIRNQTNGFSWVLLPLTLEAANKNDFLWIQFVHPCSVLWSTFDWQIMKYLCATVWENCYVRIPKRCTRNSKVWKKKHKYLWNVEITEKCHLLLDRYYIHFLYATATSSTVTQRTKANIMCVLKCWMLTLRHNKHKTVHIHFIAPHITQSSVRLYSIHIFLPGKSVVSPDSSHH